MKCFFHSADLDGRCSAAIVNKKFPNCELIGIDYGENFPWETVDYDEEVIMVDFCLQPFSLMRTLNAHCKLTWIDHHQAAIDTATQAGFVANNGSLLDSSKAACELAWSYFFPEAEVPFPVFLIGRYDVWQHKEHEGCLEFQYGMREFDTLTIEKSALWKSLLSNNYNKTGQIIKKGIKILEYEKNRDKQYADLCAFDVTFEGLKCIAINKDMANSSVFDSVYDSEIHDAMLRFSYRKEGFWTCSMYTTKDDVDILSVCKKYGGGGHKQAAGFQCGELPFLNKEDKKIPVVKKIISFFKKSS